MQVNANYSAQAAYQAGSDSDASAGYSNDYLKGLKSRFPGARFSVCDLLRKSDIKSFGMGRICCFSDVIISPGALDTFANSPASSAALETELRAFIDQERHEKAVAAEKGHSLFWRGMVLDRNGGVSFWAIGAQTDAEQRGGGNPFDKYPPRKR